MKLGIFGSRTLKDDRVRALIYDEIEKTGADVIVTAQEPMGVCTIAQQVAKEKSLTLELHFLNISKYSRGAFDHRSREVVNASDKIFLIHDGKSKGTSNELKLTEKMGKPYRYEMIMATDLYLQRAKDKRLEAFESGATKYDDFQLEFDFDLDLDM